VNDKGENYAMSIRYGEEVRLHSVTHHRETSHRVFTDSRHTYIDMECKHELRGMLKADLAMMKAMREVDAEAWLSAVM
jgi:hypothetical protein